MRKRVTLNRLKRKQNDLVIIQEEDEVIEEDSQEENIDIPPNSNRYLEDQVDVGSVIFSYLKLG